MVFRAIINAREQAKRELSTLRETVRLRAEKRTQKKAEAEENLKVATKAASDVLAERERQKSVEGWTEAHDDLHLRGEMALAASSYAMWSFPAERTTEAARAVWPWADEWFKPKDPRRDLVRAGALIIAEIERLDRVDKRPVEPRVRRAFPPFRGPTRTGRGSL